VSDLALQERYSPEGSCFGCGPRNERGLRIRSFPDPATAGETVAEWTGSPHHEAFPGMLSGGIIGTLLDCHSNWTAAWHLMSRAGAENPPCTVTADYAVKLLRPTPTSAPVRLRARVVSSTDDRAEIEAELVSLASGKTCATCRGTFVAVKPGHPAYHRW
jgi:acyl-coenzyme A thioesterase PaaI-like protein